MCIILIEIIHTFIPGEQAIFMMAYFIDAHVSLDFKESTHIWKWPVNLHNIVRTT